MHDELGGLGPGTMAEPIDRCGSLLNVCNSQFTTDQAVDKSAFPDLHPPNHGKIKRLIRGFRYLPEF
jgi:hypothetical protein